MNTQSEQDFLEIYEYIQISYTRSRNDSVDSVLYNILEKIKNTETYKEIKNE